MLCLQRRQPVQLRTWGAPAPGSTPHLQTSSALQARPQQEQGAWMFLRRPITVLPHPYPLTYGHSSHPLLDGCLRSSPGVQVSATRRAQTGACPLHSVHPKDARPSHSWKQPGRQGGPARLSRENSSCHTSEATLIRPKARSYLCLLWRGPPPHTPLSFTFRHTPVPRLTPYASSAEIQPQHLALMTLQSLRQCAGSFHVAGRRAAHGQL